MRYLHFLFFLALLSCKNRFQSEPIVELYDQKLYYDEIINELPENEVDTNYFIENYIGLWIKETLLLNNAKINLPSKQKQIDRKTQDYYNRLLIHKYQKELISQKIDTNVSANKILEYYIKNKENFVLKNEIVKINFVSLKKSAPNLEKLRTVFFDNADVEFINEYCNQFADKFYLFDTTWVYFNEILQYLPNDIVKERRYLTNIKNNIFEDEENFYFLKIFEKKRIGELSPITLVKENIRSTIVNENKLRYLNELDNQLYMQAITDNKLKINR